MDDTPITGPEHTTSPDTTGPDTTGPEHAMPGLGGRRRSRHLVTAGVATAALLAGVLGTTVAISTASADPTASPSAASARWGRPALPTELRDDLRKVAAADPANRQAMLEGILQQAKDGKYGDRVKQVAERIEQRLSELPDNLKQDLAKLLAAPDDQRAELRTQLRQRAEAGEYGPQVQQWVKDFHPGFRGGPFGPFGRR